MCLIKLNVIWCNFFMSLFQALTSCPCSEDFTAAFSDFIGLGTVPATVPTLSVGLPPALQGIRRMLVLSPQQLFCVYCVSFTFSLPEEKRKQEKSQFISQEGLVS